VTLASVHEPAVLSDTLLSSVAPCNVSFRLSRNEDFVGEQAEGRLALALTSGEQLELGCAGERNETFQAPAGSRLLGYIEDAHRAYQHLYASAATLQSGGSNSEDEMPCLVQERVQDPSPPWGPDWRLAQRGWYSQRLTRLGSFGPAHQAVVRDRAGVVVHLEGATADALVSPKAWLAAVEWFVQLALIVRRVPVIPPLPCALTTMQWPTTCPNGMKPLESWYTLYTEEDNVTGKVQFHCDVNPRACTDSCVHRGVSGNLDSFLARGLEFQERFVADPVQVKLPSTGVNGKSISSAKLHEGFFWKTNKQNVFVDWNDLPSAVSGLTTEDNHMLLGCRDPTTVERVMHCATQGLRSSSCLKLFDPAEFAQLQPKPKVLYTILFTDNVWMTMLERAHLAPDLSMESAGQELQQNLEIAADEGNWTLAAHERIDSANVSAERSESGQGNYSDAVSLEALNDEVNVLTGNGTADSPPGEDLPPMSPIQEAQAFVPETMEEPKQDPSRNVTERDGIGKQREPKHNGAVKQSGIARPATVRQKIDRAKKAKVRRKGRNK